MTKVREPASILTKVKLGSVPNFAHFRLYLIADTGVCAPEKLAGKVEEALAAGVKAVRLRDNRLSTRELLKLGKKLRASTKAAGADFFVTDRLDLFYELNADGIHLPQEGIPVSILRKQVPDCRLGKSVHSLEGAIQAENDGADFITYSPVFETPSKMGILKPTGLEALQEVCAAVKIPVLALGGITPSNIRSVMKSGASGAAVIRAILDSSSITEAVLAFKMIMTETAAHR